VAVIDTSVDKHGTRDVAEAFVEFLYTIEAQQIFAEHGLRVLNQQVAEDTQTQYPAVPDLFTVAYFGGWGEITVNIFGEEGVFTQTILDVQGGN
jgi:sulfate transport system substrate-binding protein